MEQWLDKMRADRDAFVAGSKSSTAHTGEGASTIQPVTRTTRDGVGGRGKTSGATRRVPTFPQKIARQADHNPPASRPGCPEPLWKSTIGLIALVATVYAGMLILDWMGF